MFGAILVTGFLVELLARDAVTFFTLVNPSTSSPERSFSQPRVRRAGAVSSTLMVTIGSAIIALPLGVATAIYLSEYASAQARSVLKPALEILAGVPTVVYGFFALVYVTPASKPSAPVNTFNILCESIVVGIMIIPMVATLSEDAMSAVPDALRQAGYGMGATKFDVPPASSSPRRPRASSPRSSSLSLAPSARR